ncbi:uncharacterized protein LOC118410155 [Branchiostoma floridae]|uniref:Uncharacterized protein LOC118410155 n=1 Tax=Branchiostoma floridae TaxID=7739 RepID=A0A9J7MH99_BRAFL|nr:uncharacterized protein LOC118410155 [Branchiostoma floridae]
MKKMSQTMTTAEIEECDIYMDFYRYDFEHDQRFQDGFRKSLSAENTIQGEEFLRAKVFYFNKFCRRGTRDCIHVDGFKKWLDAMQQKEFTAGLGYQRPEGSPETKEDTSDAEVKFGLEDQTEVASANTTGTAESSTSSYPTSFSDIIHCVQEGKEIPGIEKLDVQPINCEPTLSTQTRPPKPWEGRT